MTLCPVISQSGYETHAGSATYFALSAGLFLLSWVTLCWVKWIIKPQKNRSWQGPLEPGPLDLPWPSPAQGRSNHTGLLWAQSKPEHRFHSFSGTVFQCLTILMGNRFSLRFNWHFSSSTLCPLPSVQTLRGAWLHLNLHSLLWHLSLLGLVRFLMDHF